MTNHTISLDYYRSFLLVAQTGSLSSAASQLGLSQPTLGRHITALEAALGTSLFVRSQHGFVPTDAALRLIPYAQAIEANAAAFMREASAQEVETLGTIRISASEMVGSEILPAILTQLKRTHPTLTIELVLSNQADDLSSRAADIAVRMFPPEQKSLLSRKIGEVELGTYAHENYVRDCGMPKVMEDLRNHAIIGFDTENDFLRRFIKAFPALHRDRFAFRSDSDIAQLAAIRAGYGIGVCQVGIARKSPELIRVLENLVTLKLGIWLIMPEELKMSPRCKIVFKGLAEGLEAHVLDAKYDILKG